MSIHTQNAKYKDYSVFFYAHYFLIKLQINQIIFKISSGNIKRFLKNITKLTTSEKRKAENKTKGDYLGIIHKELHIK